MNEQYIQRKIIKWLEGEGYYVVKIISANKSGVPDLLVCVDGKFVAIEVKTPKTKNNVSKLQKYNLEKIKKCGGIAIVAYDVETVKSIVKGDNYEKSN